MSLPRLFQRAKEIYNDEGLFPLLVSIISSVRGRVKRLFKRFLARRGLLTPYHNRYRGDSEERWDMISNELEVKDGSAMDIGCASGYFSGQLAERGLFTIGIERSRTRLTSARRSKGNIKRLAFMHSELTPSTITDLPSVDVVLLLTVYHHWTMKFGQDSAEDMLRTLASKSNKIFFEPPGHIDDKSSFNHWQISDEPVGENESIQAYYEELLFSILGESVSVEHLGTSSYPADDDRTDPVFMIDCSQYEN